MAAIFRSGLLISLRPKISLSSFESLILSFSHPKWKSQKFLDFLWVHRPTHCLNHTLDLVLTYGIDVEQLRVFPHNPVLSNHFLITFGFTLLDYTASKKKCMSMVSIRECCNQI